MTIFRCCVPFEFRFSATRARSSSSSFLPIDLIFLWFRQKMRWWKVRKPVADENRINITKGIFICLLHTSKFEWCARRVNLNVIETSQFNSNQSFHLMFSFSGSLQSKNFAFICFIKSFRQTRCVSFCIYFYRQRMTNEGKLNQFLSLIRTVEWLPFLMEENRFDFNMMTWF